MNHVKNILILILCILISGCESFSKRHATRAILLVEEKNFQTIHDNSSVSSSAVSSSSSSDKKLGKSYILPQQPGSFQYFGNPIFIHNDTKFSIRIDEIGAGWLYREPPKDSFKNVEDFNFQKIDGDPISKAEFDHFRGRELWILTTISSLNPNDPLETKSKRYFKATNVKFDAQSYALVPLDSDERFIFTHESDMSYRIKIQLYSINNFELKKELAKIAKNPGVIGIGKALVTTLKNTVGAVAGDVIESTLNDKAGEGLALERFLLSVDAVEEFSGEALVLRSEDFDQRKASVILQKSILNSINTNIDKTNKDNSNKSLIDEIIKKSNGEFLSFPSPVVQTSYVLLDYFKNNSMKECDKSYGLNSWSSNFYRYYQLRVDDGKVVNESPNDCHGKTTAKSNQMLDKTENISFNQPSKITDFGDNLNKYSYLKFSVIESPSARSYVDRNKYSSSNIHLDSYASSLDQLMDAIRSSKISQLELKYNRLLNDFSDAYKSCIDPKNCVAANDLEKELVVAKKAYEDELVNSKSAVNAINHVKSEIRFDEWRQHLMRPAD